jgi:hypothetical protein
MTNLCRFTNCLIFLSAVGWPICVNAAVSHSSDCRPIKAAQQPSSSSSSAGSKGAAAAAPRGRCLDAVAAATEGYSGSDLMELAAQVCRQLELQVEKTSKCLCVVTVLGGEGCCCQVSHSAVRRWCGMLRGRRLWLPISAVSS